MDTVAEVWGLRVALDAGTGSVRLGFRLIKDVGAESAMLIVEERERHDPYITAGDLVRRTGLKPQTALRGVGSCRLSHRPRVS